ncbi:hypothetical protein ACFL3G_02515 [Planctomycetota bacterium]
MCKIEEVKEQQEYVWNYFQLHASQRMASFNFFVVISALLTAGLARTFDKDYPHHSVGIVLGVGMVVISFVFWKLDQRVRFFVKHAETALKELEISQSTKINNKTRHYAAIFSSEEKETTKRKVNQKLCPWKWHMSYSNCFAWIYIVFSVLGLLGLIKSILEISGSS